MPAIFAGPLALSTPFSTVRSMLPSVMSMPGSASLSEALVSLAATLTEILSFGTSLMSGSASFTFTEASAESFVVSRPVWRMRFSAGWSRYSMSGCAPASTSRSNSASVSTARMSRASMVPVTSRALEPEGMGTSAPSIFSVKSLSVRAASPFAPTSGGRSLK